MLTAIGITPTILVGSGGLVATRSAFSTTGRRIDTGIGPGARLMAGRGSDTNPGVGRLITMGAGFITTTTGPGVREVSFTRSVAGGARRWLHSCSTFRLATTSAGTRCRITKEIRIRVDTVAITMVVMVVMGVMDVMAVMDAIPEAAAVGGETGTTMDHGEA